jgi:hypothetical protein
LLLYFITVREVWIWAGLLFFTRVGAASIETMADTYFFKHIRPENEEFIGVYRSAAPVAFVIGPLAASLVFLVIPTFNMLYIVLSAILLCGVYLSSIIRRDDI